MSVTPVETTPVVPAEVPPVEPEIVLPSEQPKEKLFAGKYKTHEELEKGYLELQKLMSSRKQDPPPSDETPPNPEGSTPEGAVAAAGLDMEVLNKEFTETGTLSEASFKALESKGISKETVEIYIAGQKALVEQATGKVYALVGGKESYETMVKWAALNLPKADQEAFDAHMAGDFSSQKLAVDALRARYTKAVGSNPHLIMGEGASPAAEGYESRAQMVADMSDPRYEKDPAYRAKVERKVARTTVF